MAILNSTLVQRIVASIHGSADCLMLFGSFARGDTHAQSDVDVLQLAKTTSAGYKNGQVTVSVYGERDLFRMAEDGNLFVLHLRTDGIVIRDEGGKLRRCLDAYSPPSSYTRYKTIVGGVASLLDVQAEAYESRWKQYNNVALFVLRTALYIRMAEQNRPAFAIRTIASLLGDERLTNAIGLKRDTVPNWKGFCRVRALSEEYLVVKCVNPYGSVEALVTNCHASNPLVVSFGLRLISQESREMDYDVFVGMGNAK